MPRNPAAILLVWLIACGPSKGTSTDADTDATSDTASSSTAGVTTTTPTTTPAEPTSTGTGTGTSNTTTPDNGGCDDAPPNADELCAAQTDRTRCNAATAEVGSGSCLWIPWFPVRLVEGTCSFGDPRGSCAFIRCQSEGCATLSPCNSEGFGGAFMTDSEGKVTIGFADWCLSPPAPAQACIFDTDQQLLEGPPECACLCDPAFPGV